MNNISLSRDGYKQVSDFKVAMHNYMRKNPVLLRLIYGNLLNNDIIVEGKSNSIIDSSNTVLVKTTESLHTNIYPIINKVILDSYREWFNTQERISELFSNLFNIITSMNMLDYILNNESLLAMTYVCNFYIIDNENYISIEF